MPLPEKEFEKCCKRIRKDIVRELKLKLADILPFEEVLEEII